MPVGDPPPFYSRQYWNARFTSEPNPFDWLHSADVLDEHLIKAIEQCKHRGVNPKILHIGCGTSLLSLQLRGLVQNPEQVWNVDFSEKAVEIGRKWEQELVRSGTWENLDTSAKSLEKMREVLRNVQNGKADFTETAPDDHGSPSSPASSTSERMMHWEAVDLLSLPSVLSALEPNSFDIIIEKSCSDAIACGNDVLLSSLDPSTTIISYYTSPTEEDSQQQLSKGIDQAPAQAGTNSEQDALIHPVSLLALHLAQLARSGCRWMMLTFSEDRIPFKYSPFKKANPLPPPLPDPLVYWTPTVKEPVRTVESEGKRDQNAAGQTIYRPDVYHYIMILERNDDSKVGVDVA